MEPHFPYKYPDGPRPYQTEAYNEWLKNNKCGILLWQLGQVKQ